jgi:hypothetical protein
VPGRRRGRRVSFTTFDLSAVDTPDLSRKGSNRQMQEVRGPFLTSRGCWDSASRRGRGVAQLMASLLHPMLTVSVHYNILSTRSPRLFVAVSWCPNLLSATGARLALLRAPRGRDGAGAVRGGGRERVPVEAGGAHHDPADRAQRARAPRAVSESPTPDTMRWRQAVDRLGGKRMNESDSLSPLRRMGLDIPSHHLF